MKIKNVLICIILITSIMFSLCIECSGATKISEAEEIIGIANRGMWHDFPENSLPALTSAAKTGINAVLADISVTKDNIAVAVERNSASRMLDGAENDAVSEYTLEELQKFYLKNSCGGQNNTASSYKASTLTEIISAFEDLNSKLVLKFDAADFDVISKTVSEKDGITLYITGDEKSVKDILAKNGESFEIFTEKRGNIVFLQTAFIDFNVKNHSCGTVLKTTNRYGVNFNQTVLKHFTNSTKAIADTSNSELAGAREDCEKWWDDLVSRGYSVIITNDANAFCDYLKANDTSRKNLSDTYKKYTSEWTLPAFKSVIFNDYKKAYDDAVNEAEKLLNDSSSSTQALNDCRTALIKACDDIDMNFTALEQGKAGMTVSPARIALCVGAAAAVIAVQIFFFKRREKV